MNKILSTILTILLIVCITLGFMLYQEKQKPNVIEIRKEIVYVDKYTTKIIQEPCPLDPKQIVLNDLRESKRFEFEIQKIIE